LEKDMSFGLASLFPLALVLTSQGSLGVPIASADQGSPLLDFGVRGIYRVLGCDNAALEGSEILQRARQLQAIRIDSRPGAVELVVERTGDGSRVGLVVHLFERIQVAGMKLQRSELKDARLESGSFDPRSARRVCRESWKITLRTQDVLTDHSCFRTGAPKALWGCSWQHEGSRQNARLEKLGPGLLGYTDWYGTRCELQLESD
jgi:hypothetical protein